MRAVGGTRNAKLANRLEKIEAYDVPDDDVHMMRYST